MGPVPNRGTRAARFARVPADPPVSAGKAPGPACPPQASAPPAAGGARPGLRATLVALFLAEMLLVALVYQFLRPVDCALGAAPRACALTAGLGTKLAAVLALLALYRPDPRAGFPAAARASLGPLPLQLAGLGLLLWPAVAPVPALLLFWTTGGLVATLAAARALAPFPIWTAWIRHRPATVAAILAAGFLLPGLVEALDVLWRVDALAHLTFRGTARVVALVSADLTLDEARYLIGSGGFVVMVADGCSGIQGVALIGALVSAYLFFDRARLRFPAALVLLPLGITLSLGLNILRIAALIEIGARGAPELAVNGFHSNAGSLLFALLSFGLVWIARRVPAFRATRAAIPHPPPPILRDPAAARILPFVAMMSASLALGTFAPEPGLWYPLRAIVMAATLALFLPAYRGIDWTPGLAGPVIGVLIGLLWLAARPPSGPEDLALSARLARLSPENLMLWTLFRVLGAVVLAPVIEELFFRGYLLPLGRTRPLRLAALLASSALFALPHERWLAAFLTGLALGALAWRGRLGPAVAAHMAANAVLAAFALATGDWSVF